MSDVVYSHAGIEIAVANSIQNQDLNLAQFEALSYTPISNLGSLGEYGLVTNLTSYDSLDTKVTTKAKGLSDGGTPELEFARDDDDPGQAILRTIGQPHVFNNYCFRVTKQDGAIDYLRGLLSGPTSPGGRNEDFDLNVFVLAINQLVIHVPSSTLPVVWLFDSGTLAADGIITSDGVIPA